MPNAVRDTEKVAARPDWNRAVNVAVSSFSTSPISLLTGAAPCPTTAPSGSGRFGDLDRHVAAGDRRDRAAQVLALVDDVRADVAERPGTHAALEPPAQRAARVAGVVAPVAGVQGGQLAQLAVRMWSRIAAIAGRAPVAVADGGDDLALLLQLDHRPGVLHRPGQRLLAQHVLARGDQRLGDRPVQRVADHDAHRVDRRVLGDGLPARQRLLVAVAARAVLGQRDVRVGDRGQPDRREPRPGDRAGHPVGRRVAAAGHPGADDCDGDLLRHVLDPSLVTEEAGVPERSASGGSSVGAL